MINTSESNKTIIARQRFFEKVVHLSKIKDCISGKNEAKVIPVIESLGFILGKDFVRQHPIGQRFVLDFAFANEQVALEIDGDGHFAKKQKIKDRKRDNWLHSNNWVSIRIKDKDMFSTYRLSFFKNLIKEIVLERREQWEKGDIRRMDLSTYYDQDYD